MYDKFDKNVVLEDNVEILLKQRYYKPGENWFKLCVRVVNDVCKNESDEFKEKVFELIYNRIFLPNSPCLVNAGTRNQGLLACFTVTPKDDDLAAHIDYLKDIALVAKKGGGVGFSGTFFRPKNSPVAGSAHGYSYGPNAWAVRVSEYMDMMTQAGFRKMALMYNLRSDHPDLDDYINLKQTENEQFVYNFNQSVMATDDWMEQAQIDGTKENEQFLRLCKNAWNNGEPGLMFYDTINNNTPYKLFGETIEESNPCVLEGTLVTTPNGLIPVENIKVGDEITTVVGTEKVLKIDKLENIQTYRVVFSDGDEQYVTAGHIYHTTRYGAQTKKINNSLTLSETNVKDYVRVLPTDNLCHGDDADYETGKKVGVLLGDGCYTQKMEKRNRFKICSSIDDNEYNENLQKLFDITTKPDNSIDGSKSVSFSSSGFDVIYKLRLTPAYAHEKYIPRNMFNQLTKNFVIGVLDGLLATDGNVNLKSNHPQIRWTTTSKELAKDIRALLLIIGIHGFVHERPPRNGNINGRTINGKHNSYSISISGCGFKKYYETTKLHSLCPKKYNKILQGVTEFVLTGNRHKAQILSIEPYKMGTVYDLYCESDTWITSGYVQRGCSEQLLPSHLACVLASINIAHDYFYDNNGAFLYDKLESVAQITAHFLDNVGDVNSFPNETFKKRYEGFRPIGVGIMGYADALLKQKLRYGGEKALTFLEQVMKHLYRAARDESVRLGILKGVPNRIGRLGRRNVTLLSIAPTGSIGMIAGCSHSIEPIFSPTYTRIDERGQQYFISHELADESYFASAINNVDSKVVLPDEHLDTQIVAQKFCDTGIAKTVNLPNSATVDDVKYIFLKAWRNGCKGITVYRNGSREFQVLTIEENVPGVNCKNGVCEI